MYVYVLIAFLSLFKRRFFTPFAYSFPRMMIMGIHKTLLFDTNVFLLPTFVAPMAGQE